MSTTTSSSAAFPGGEAFEFHFSPNGHWVLALSSSRIYVIDGCSTKVAVKRELKVLRRPVAAAILDDGSLLAVLSNDHLVNIYDLTYSKVKHKRGVSLEHPPHAIALTPQGEVLAAAFDGGVEVVSLMKDVGALDHRAIKCDRVDSISFSGDGTMLLGTTKTSKNPNTVILSAPYYNEEGQELPAADQISHLWTTQILFPNSSRDCSNATLLPNRSDGDANWTFTYDKVFESFRAVRTDDLRNGTTYFTGPRPPSRDGPRNTRKKLMPCTLPASSDCGELVAAGFLGKEVWLYGVPEGLEAAPVSQTDDPNSQSGSSAGPSTPTSASKSPARSFTRGEAAELTKLPKWQVLVDKYRNVFAKGRRVAEVSGVSGVCWVRHNDERQAPQSLAERLIIAAPGGIAGDPELEQDGFASVDGGRLIVLDFDRMTTNGDVEEITFDVGNNTPELLEEDDVDMETEVALARRRTVKRDPSQRATSVDALTSVPPVPPVPGIAPTANAVANSNSAVVHTARHPIQADENVQSEAANVPLPEEGLSLEEASAAFDGPYSHAHPRSRNSLYRSATAVAANRERNPQRPRILDDAAPRFRRPGDRTELPHESDADNWVPPPPPYAPKSDMPLPEELRLTLLPRTNTEPAVGVGRRTGPRRVSTMYETPGSNTNSRRISSLPERPGRPGRQHSSDATSPPRHNPRSASDSMPVSQREALVSPISTVPSLHERSQPSAASSRQPLSASTNRRAISVVFGRIGPSLKRPKTSGFASPTSPSNASSTRNPNESLSLPPSPTRLTHADADTETDTDRPTTPLTLTGTNLQQRLDYPLPPAPTISHLESLNRRFNPSPIPTNTTTTSPRGSEPSAYAQNQQTLRALAQSMPSAQQLANLQQRTRTRTPSPRMIPNLHTVDGGPIPAPPRGALGAAGSTTPLHSPARSASNRNSYARSSPALLRPRPGRLDTIESVSSVFSRSRTRSGSRPLTGEGRPGSGNNGGVRRGSGGLALKLDRVGEGRRGLFGRKGRNRNRDDGERGGKCVVM